MWFLDYLFNIWLVRALFDMHKFCRFYVGPSLGIVWETKLYLNQVGFIIYFQFYVNRDQSLKFLVEHRVKESN